MSGYFYTDVINCARCGETHRHVLFEPFTKTPEPFTHYGTCPATNEPILMIVQQQEQKAR